MNLQQTSEHVLDIPRGRDRRLALAALMAGFLLAVALMILIALPSLSKPLVMDEMEFPAVARAIKETGLPIYYRGETYAHNVGLWHPPLYIVSLAAWQLLFGSSALSNRAYGLTNACLALVLIGLFAIYRRGWRGYDWRQNSALLLALLVGLGFPATAPLYIQGTILPDIDTQVLPLLITAFFLLLFEARRRLTPARYWAVFILLLTVQLFAKLTTPILLIPSFVVFELVRALGGSKAGLRLRHNLRRRAAPDGGTAPRRYWVALSFQRAGLHRAVNALLPIAAGMVSVLLLVVLWFVIARLWGVNFSLPFIYLTQSANNPASQGGTASQILGAIIEGIPGHVRYLIQWVGYPTLLLVLLLIAREIFRPSQGILYGWERAAVYTFLILLTLMYIVLKPAPFEFPKYYPPLMPLIGLLIVDALISLYNSRRLGLAAAIFGAEVIAYLVYVRASVTLSGQDFIYVSYYSKLNSPLFIYSMVIPLGVALAVNGLAWLALRGKFAAPLVVAALAVALGWQVAVSAKQMTVPYSTTYMYGEQPFTKTVDFLRANLPKDAIVIAPKDVGYMLEDQWRYIELDIDPRPQFANAQAQFLVFRSNDYYGHTIQETPEILTAVQQQFATIATVDNFVIMRRKSS
jgi:hypothetical protein